MSLLLLKNCHLLLDEHYHLNIEHLAIQSHQHTVILGPNGSGKSALAACVAGEGQWLSGTRHFNHKLAWVSVEQQQALIEAEKQKDCADILDIVPVPTTVQEVLFDGSDSSAVNATLLARIKQIFSLETMLAKPFRALSTGETRKLLLAKALILEPELLILDDPWDGLDVKTTEQLNQLLEELSSSTTLLLVLNRVSEVPGFCKQVILMDAGTIGWQAEASDNLQEQLQHITQLQHMQQSALTLPGKDDDCFAPHPLEENAPLVRLTNAKVNYGDNVVFSGLDWTVMPQQHWQVTGPNGSGKTCLLNLITGDHPQCYVNDIFVFGFQRGSGESIWEIKQYIGYLSNAFHLDYKVNCSVLHVVMSGYYNSIGLYQQPSANQLSLATQWLQLIGLEDVKDRPFFELSFGDQRMVLIARAMVKHPSLLILDEPCNGLDDINRLKVLALIELLAREGNTTLLYVNHHQEDVIPSIQNHLDMAKI
ncbi:molybdate ABC transporter ATP-binding protein ModF [Paraglaciecola sp. 2405UD69-4]|uniref:molybdate ABC transporter ATP-binding protein ModF n=1 Tax=Paraglaciecola sp. 2405UD69-4 TaxID=3391836 RepID=UPI0039C97445